MELRDQFASLRGFLVMWIVVGHVLLHERFAGIYDAGFARHEDFGLLGHLIALRFIGIDLFFMLSGFVLTLHYYSRFTRDTKGRDIDWFYRKRLKRIYPMHLAMMAVIGLYALLGVPHPITSGNEDVIFNHWQWSGVINLLLMNGWGIMPVSSWNEPSWSLSITFLIYVLFPNMLIILKRLPAKGGVYIGFILALIFAYALQRELMPFTSQSDGAGAIIRGVVFGLMGVAGGLYTKSQTMDFWRQYGAFFNLLFLALIVWWTYGHAFSVTWMHLLYAPLLWSLYASGYQWISTGFAAWLGTRSFAMFMVHYPALLLLRHVGGAAMAQWASTTDFGKLLAYLVTFSFVILATEIAYRLFDRPYGVLRKD